MDTITELVSELRDEMDNDAYSTDKIYRAIGRAEAMFNRKLRVPQMEARATLDIVQEATVLPSDFLQMRTVYQEGSPDRPLRSMSPEALRTLYSGRSGTPAAYAIEGSSIIVGPVGTTTLTLVYYAKVPALTNSSPSNWLLTDYPDIYIHQVLAILFAKEGDDNRAAGNLGFALRLIDDASAAGRNARWGASPLSPLLVQQAVGTRI